MSMSDPGWINSKRKDGDPYKCEEASFVISSTPTMHMPCSAPATHKMWSDKDNRNYWMCDACAAHNLRRGMVEVAA